MKKLTSLLMAVLLLATVLTAFAVPAFAEETKTAGEYRDLAWQLEKEQKYEEAADAYMNAGRLYMADKSSPADIAFLDAGSAFLDAGSAFFEAGQMYRMYLGNHAFAAEAYIKSGLCYLKANKFTEAASSYNFAGMEYTATGDDAAAGEAYLRAGGAHIKAGKWNDWNDAALDFNSAASSFEKSIPFSAAAAYLGEAYAHQKCGNMSQAESAIFSANQILNGIYEFDFNTGSTLSEGNLTIIVGIAAAVVFGLGGFILGTKKKKKPALASGTESTDEE